MVAGFSILGLTELTAVVAFVLASDRIFFQGGHDLIPYLLMIGGFTGVYLGIRRRADDRFASVLWSTGIWAAVVMFVNGLAMCIIVAERFHRRIHDDIAWVSAWPGFLILVLILTLLGSVFGILLALVPAAIIARWKRGDTP